MLIDLKSVLLFGLVALSQAKPMPRPGRDAPEIRASKKRVTDVICPDGTRLAQADVGSALSAGRKAKDGTVGYELLTNWFPHYFGNKSKDGPVFGATAKLKEYPIVQGGTFGEPGKSHRAGRYRVVYKADGAKDFVGVMREEGGGNFRRCPPVEAPAPPQAAPSQPGPSQPGPSQPAPPHPAPPHPAPPSPPTPPHAPGSGKS